MTAVTYLLFILILTTLLVSVHKKVSTLQTIPLVLILYIIFMIFGNLGLWDHTHQDIQQLQTRTINNLLPAMIFLMMLGFNLKLFQQLGKKMLLAFFSTTFSLIAAFTTIFYLFRPFLWDKAALDFATLAGSWSGGTINMIAVGKVVGISETALSKVVAVDSIIYTFWVMLLLFLVPFAKRFNRFTKADIEINSFDISCPISNDTRSYIRIIILAIAVALTLNLLALKLPQTGFISSSFYTVVLATVLGLIGSKTKLKELPSHSVANAMLYLIIALIASKAKFGDISTLLLFTALGFFIITIHALIMVGLSKLFRLDLFSIGIASLAHIGGTAGATILASSYNKTLIPIAVVMATAGYLLGTVVGLLIAGILI